MKVSVLKICGFLALLLIAGVAHAEGNCPPGYYQVGDPRQGSTGCAPLPDGAQDQAPQSAPRPPPEQWANHYGAIAADEALGILTASTDMPSRGTAENAAMSDCKARGGINCVLEIWYVNQCVAVVAASKIFNVNPGATIAEATQKGMRMCEPAANDCHVYYTACSLPVRIQ